MTGSSNRPCRGDCRLSQNVTAHPGFWRRFAGEVFVEVHANVRGEDVPDPSRPTTTSGIDALKRASINGSRRWCLISAMPARRDRKTRPARQFPPQKLVANLIPSRVRTACFPIDRRAIRGFSCIRPITTISSPRLSCHADIRRFATKNIMVTLSDVGGVVRAATKAPRQRPLAIVDKRHRTGGQIGSDEHHRRREGSLCVLIDDIVGRRVRSAMRLPR